jgi:enoyl-CoA hydratase
LWPYMWNIANSGESDATGRRYTRRVTGSLEFTVDPATGLARVVLTRPPLNLLEPQMIAAIGSVFEALRSDASVRAAVVEGAGRAFSAGMDVNVFRDMDSAGARRLIQSLRDAIEAVHSAPFPTIAAVRGPCLGGAFELALACDMRIAAEDAIFGLPEVRVGLPSVIHAALLPRMVPPAVAAELLLAGTTIDAGEARRTGLVNEIVGGGDLESAIERLTGRLLEAAPGAVRLQKELIVKWREASFSQSVELSIEVFARAFETGEPREGADAFLQKRKPWWAQGQRHG